MVMTIPFLNKIKVLAKISPSLPPPGTTNTAQDARGCVIVLEGSDKELLAEVGSFISSHLSHDASCAVKSWGESPTRLPSISVPEAADTEVRNHDTVGPMPLSFTPEEKDAFKEYLNVILDWHAKSREMMKHIAALDPSKALPIALVPHGFSLTLSDTFALSIPIEDSYAPVDHWQWMATLWRGIVGPDLTIYVTRASMEELHSLGGVEIRDDCNCVIVRVPVGEGVSEKVKRRLGFEVLEFVRGFEGVFGKH